MLFQSPSQKNTREYLVSGQTNKFELRLDGISDVGCLRKNNEDTIYWKIKEKADDKNNFESLLLVADGMGGHNAGEIASGIAKEHISTAYKYWKKTPHKTLIKVFTEANRKIFRAARRNKEYASMGTTCTALVITNDFAYCAHVGDSRVYLIRGTSIYKMTEDHTIRTALEKEGLINSNTPVSDIETSVITRAMGIHKTIKVDTWKHGFPVQLSDKFLLCSDGLTDMLSDDEIKLLVLQNSWKTVCSELVNKAKERGGYDNISVIIAYLENPQNKHHETRL